MGTVFPYLGPYSGLFRGHLGPPMSRLLKDLGSTVLQGGWQMQKQYPSTPQLRFKTPQIPSNRDQKALTRGT